MAIFSTIVHNILLVNGFIILFIFIYVIVRTDLQRLLDNLQSEARYTIRC